MAAKRTRVAFELKSFDEGDVDENGKDWGNMPFDKPPARAQIRKSKRLATHPGGTRAAATGNQAAADAQQEKAKKDRERKTQGAAPAATRADATTNGAAVAVAAAAAAAAAALKKQQEDDTSKITFQYMSDLHMEQPLQSPRHTTPDGNIIYPRDYDYSFNKTADYLILAGDLTVVKSKTDRDEFIQWLIRVCNMGYKRVFWILGDTDFDDSRNHEIVVKIYVRNFTLLRAIEAANITNLTFLENERFDLTEGSRSISILGTVLWSAYDYVAMAGLAPKKPDRPGHTDYDHDEQHWIARKYLNDEITKIKANATTKNNPILVITHHPPTRRGVADPNPKIAAKDQKNSWKDGTDILSGPANPSAQDATLRQPFVCNQTRDPRNAPGKRQGGLDPGIALLGAGDVWVYGHTHYNNPNLVARDGVVLKCNQRGDHADSSKAYKNRPLDGRVETPAWSFDPGLTFKI